MLNNLQMIALPLLFCIGMSGILSGLGLHVLKREVIFIDIALAQTVVIGAIVAHLLFHAEEASLVANTCAFTAAIGMAAFYAVASRRVTRIPLEAVIGISYAITAAAALFLVGIAPGGHLHVQHLLSGSILWTTQHDLILCLPVFFIAGLLLYFLHQPLMRATKNAHTQKNGMAWDFVFYLLVSAVITLAVHNAGVVLVFSFLIIPATAASLFPGSWRKRLIIAWILGIASSTLGLGFATVLDFSVGPAIALFLGVGLILAAISPAAWHRTPEEKAANKAK